MAMGKRVWPKTADGTMPTDAIRTTTTTNTGAEQSMQTIQVQERRDIVVAFDFFCCYSFCVASHVYNIILLFGYAVCHC